MYVPSDTCYGWNTANGLRSGARATAGGGRSGERVVAAARLRMWARVLLEEADALIDVLRVPVDGRHRDAGEVVREEAAGSVVVAVDGAVAAALPVRGAQLYLGALRCGAGAEACRGRAGARARPTG